MASEDSGEEWEAVHEVFAENDGDNTMIDDNLPGTKTNTPALDVSQQIEAHLDKLDKYTNDQLHEMVHVFIYRRPTDMVLIEYVDMTPDDSEIYITRDSLNAVMFWQGHKAHHMRKLNVRIHNATLFHHRQFLAPPRAKTGQLRCCHANSEMFWYKFIIVICYTITCNSHVSTCVGISSWSHIQIVVYMSLLYE